MGLRGEIFSNRVLLPNRTYFFNVKENRMGDIYLNIVESKNRDNGGFDRQSVILFADDLQEFLKGFDESLKVMEKAMREKRHSGKSAAGENRDENREVRTPREGRVSREDRPNRENKPRRNEDRQNRGDRSPRDNRSPRESKPLRERSSYGSRPPREKKPYREGGTSGGNNFKNRSNSSFNERGTRKRGFDQGGEGLYSECAYSKERAHPKERTNPKERTHSKERTDPKERRQNKIK